VRTYAHSQHMKMHKYFCIHLIWMGDAVDGDMQPQFNHGSPQSLVLNVIPIFKLSNAQ
jgi:hypothetical protein